MNDFNKFLELLLTMSDKIKTNTTLIRMYYAALVVVGVPMVITAVAALIEAVAKL